MLCKLSTISYQQLKVKITEILSPPVIVGIITNQNVEKFAEIAKNKPHLLPKVKLGKTDDGRLYAINHHDVILGCKKAGPNIISEIDCEITQGCNGSADILVAHVREITINELFNPLSIYETVDYLEEKMQKNKKEILELLHLNGTFYGKLILSGMNNYISEESIQRLQTITNQLSEKSLLLPSMIAIPLYVLSKISRIESVKQQLELIDEIQLDLENMNNSTFAWHTPEQIDHMIKSNKKEANHETNSREDSTIATKTNTANVGKEKSKNKKQTDGKEEASNSSTATKNETSQNDSNNTSTQPQQKVNEETEFIKKTIPNMIIIADEQSGKPKMLVNRKTGAVSQIEKSENKDIIKTVPLTTKPLYSIPLNVTKHLELDVTEDDDSTNKIRHRNFDSVSDLKGFLKTFPKNQITGKMTLFWSSI